MPIPCSFFFFFFNDTATTEIYTLSLHDALPISIDWRRLLLLAREHGVLGQLAACLADRDASAIPPEIKPVLAEHRRAQNFLTLRLTGELFRLLELFNQGGIRALVIKGPVLAVEA